jgi:hypothetical protein
MLKPVDENLEKRIVVAKYLPIRYFSYKGENVTLQYWQTSP